MKLFVCLCLAFSLYGCVPNPPPDPALMTQGREVWIVGSNDLAWKAAGEKYYPVQGCRYRVEWGDGWFEPRDHFPEANYCDGDLRHTYKKPGAYTVKITTFDVDPLTKERVNLKIGEQVITVR